MMMMQIDKGRRNVNSFSSDNNLVDRAIRGREINQTTTVLMVPSNSNSNLNSISNPSVGVGGVNNFIEHPVSKMDTLAGVAIKYGVEVADIKRMNGLVTDLQMFALKTLQIPLPGRHPPSPILANGSATPGDTSLEKSPVRKARSDVLESLQSLRLSTPQQKVSPAMSSLQGYYGLKAPNQKRTGEGTEMSVYSKGRAHYLEDGPILPNASPFSDPPPSRHRKSRSLISNGLFDKDELAEDVPVADAGDSEAEKSNEKSVRRRQKIETDTAFRTPEKLLKEDNGGASAFSAIAGKGVAPRPKSSNRIALAADTDSSWLNPISVGLGDSLATNIFDGFRKSSSTSNLQDQERFGASAIWATSKWSLKPDFQALSAAAITRPIFDGLPKPMNARRNKAALD